MRKSGVLGRRFWVTLAAGAIFALTLVVPAHAIERSTDSFQLDDVPCGGGVTYDLQSTGTFLIGNTWQKVRWEGWVESNGGERLRLSHSFVEFWDKPKPAHTTVVGRGFGLYGDGESIIDRGVVVFGPNGPVFMAGQHPLIEIYGGDPHAATCALLTN